METSTLAFELATDFINSTNRSIFLTGKAGTGKTTFLREIKKNTPKQTAIVAPTGVAAINAGGSTIHSFFSLPFEPFLIDKQSNLNGFATNGRNDLISKLKINATRRKIFQELELLIIDEISMVRCDVLDAIDVMLRYYRFRPNESFGGVQVLLIGDLYQLSPVANEHEWRLLSLIYRSTYFFHSKVMLNEAPVYIELDKIYRQSNQDFIDLLNEVRNNNLSAKGLRLLESCYQPNFVPAENEHYITLSTHNTTADAINSKELEKLKEESVFFMAIVKGEYAEKNYPLDERLELKLGAKVMFIKNDLEKEKRYYNGKIGVVKEINKEQIVVECVNEKEPIYVGTYLWENKRYEVNSATKKIEETVVGTFQQIPLRLAWAITIHKSQGLTFDKAIIDAGKAFAPGQVYVALSRCTSLNGLILKSPINVNTLTSDLNIVQHSSAKPPIEDVERSLIVDKSNFRLEILRLLFDFKVLIGQVNTVLSDMELNKSSFGNDSIEYVEGIKDGLEKVQLIALKFQHQLAGLNGAGEEGNLQNRFKAASEFFAKEIKQLIDLLKNSRVTTDSKMLAQSFNDEMRTLFSALAQKNFLMTENRNSFSIEEYFKLKNKFLVPEFRVNAYAGASENNAQLNSTHPVLLRSLKALRNEICERKDIPVYLVASNETLVQLSNFLPLTENDLSKISGFGPKKIQTYGDQFLGLIKNYCIQNNLETKADSLVNKKERKEKKKGVKEEKIPSKLISFDLFKTGKTIDEIARIRNFSPATIEGHLGNYVLGGEIAMDKVVDNDKVKSIEECIKNNKDATVTELKTILGNEISFSQIQLVAAFNKTILPKASS